MGLHLYLFVFLFLYVQLFCSNVQMILNLHRKQPTLRALPRWVIYNWLDVDDVPKEVRSGEQVDRQKDRQTDRKTLKCCQHCCKSLCLGQLNELKSVKIVRNLICICGKFLKAMQHDATRRLMPLITFGNGASIEWRVPRQELCNLAAGHRSKSTNQLL